MAAMDEFLMVGGEDGSFTFMNLQTCQDPVYDSFTTEHYLEVNGIEITRSRTGGMFVPYKRVRMGLQLDRRQYVAWK
jgi:hypothetical protein